ncbi:MAG: hypothetical protein DESF_02477 [Desulfovibrio sp.]
MDQAFWQSVQLYGNIAVKLAVGLATFIFVFRTTNRGQLAQMTSIDLIGNFVMGGILGGVIYNPDIGITKFIIVLAIWQAMVIAVNFLRMRTESVRKMIVGSPKPVVIKGKFLQDKLTEAGLDIGDFATLIRMQGIHSMKDIWNAQIEPNGQLTVQKKEDPHISNVVLNNGVVVEPALEVIDKDEAWLKAELLKQGYDSYENIFFAEWNEQRNSAGKLSGNLYVVELDHKKEKKDSSEPVPPQQHRQPA